MNISRLLSKLQIELLLLIKKTGKNITMHIGRGDRTIKLQDMPEPAPRPSTHGNTRITNRGTGSRKSKNAETRTC